MTLKTIKKKTFEVCEQTMRLFILPLTIQVLVVHVTIGIFVAKSLIGRSLLISESALIAVAIVICQIVQLKLIYNRKRPQQRPTTRLIRSEVVK